MRVCVAPMQKRNTIYLSRDSEADEHIENVMSRNIVNMGTKNSRIILPNRDIRIRSNKRNTSNTQE